MKRFYRILICFTVVIMASVIINFYLTHRTHYLNIRFYDLYTKSFSDPAYMEVTKELKLKADPYEREVRVSRCQDSEGADWVELEKYPNTDVYTDKKVIKKVMDYLNSIPLVCVTEKEYLASNSNKGVILEFYNERGIEVGWVQFRGEQYMLNSINMQAYKARDEGTQIISGLENLDFDIN